MKSKLFGAIRQVQTQEWFYLGAIWAVSRLAVPLLGMFAMRFALGLWVA